MRDKHVLDEHFRSLSKRAQLWHLRALAQQALEHYGIHDARLGLLSHQDTTVFKVETATQDPKPGWPKGGRFTLRIYNPSFYNADEIGAPLPWLRGLWEGGLLVPLPLRSEAGEDVVKVCPAYLWRPRPCVLYTWVPGRFQKTHLSILNLHKVGAFMARMHMHSAQHGVPEGQLRRCWSWEHQFGKGSAFGNGENALHLPKETRDVIATAGDVMLSTMRRLGESPELYGLIHGDLHQRNYVFHKGEVGAIDFEDCGLGYYLYDIAISILKAQKSVTVAGPSEVRTAFLNGYEAVRPLEAEHKKLLDVFIAARLIDDINWLSVSENPAYRARARSFALASLPTLEPVASSNPKVLRVGTVPVVRWLAPIGSLPTEEVQLGR